MMSSKIINVAFTVFVVAFVEFGALQYVLGVFCTSHDCSSLYPVKFLIHLILSLFFKVANAIGNRESFSSTRKFITLEKRFSILFKIKFKT